jgi:crotonobetainyl-CoA:carnitine CoA-transferase CaiB-like acyl-CoA transferase
MINRGKQSVALKLKDSRGKDAFLKLVKKADVLVESSRLGDMKKLGLDYDKLRQTNRRLIYASLTGYGQSGPYAKSPGHDINFLSTGGALDLLGGDEGAPAMPGFEIGDLAAGALPTVIGVLLALAAREKSGRGQMVDVSMLDGVVGMLPAPLAVYAALWRKPLRGKDRLFGKYACYNIYPARNGRYMAVGALEPAYWAALCKALDREDLIEDQFAEGDRQQVLIAELTRAFQRKEVRDWLEELQGKDVCVTEVRDISDAAHDEHLIERGLIVPKKSADGSTRPYLGVYPKLIDTPGQLGGPAPRRGQHTREVLRDLGLPIKRIDDMVRRGSAEEPEE